jgi:hypothetical protein
MVLNGVHYYSISAYAFINPEISENCTNGLDDDGDTLVDIEDIEDCVSPRGVNSSSSSTSSSLTSNSSSNSTFTHNPQAPTNSSIVFTPQA